MGGGLFGRIFGSKGAIQSLSDTVDKFVFTREEKADTLLKFLKAYEPFRLTQRLIAIPFSITFLLTFVASFVVFSIGVINGSTEIANAGTKMMEMVANVLGTPTALILGFYFAGGTINTFMRKYDLKKSEIVKDKENDLVDKG